MAFFWVRLRTFVRSLRRAGRDIFSPVCCFCTLPHLRGSQALYMTRSRRFVAGAVPHYVGRFVFCAVKSTHITPLLLRSRLSTVFTYGRRRTLRSPETTNYYYSTTSMCVCRAQNSKHVHLHAIRQKIQNVLPRNVPRYFSPLRQKMRHSFGQRLLGVNPCVFGQ